MALISSTGYASFLTVLPIVLAEKLGNDIYVGYYYSALAVISLIASLVSGKILKKCSKTWLTKFILAGLSLVFFILTVTTKMWSFAIFDSTRVICATIFFIILAIFVRDFAEEEELALAEGRYYLFSNIGWVIGPLTGGILAKEYGNESAFIFTSICYLFLLGIFLHQHLIAKHPHITTKLEPSVPRTKSILENIREYASSPNLVKAFIISFGMYFWWSISCIYIPLQLKNLGFTSDVIGLIFALNVIPLILLEFHSSDGAAKYGVRKFFTMGFGILSLSLIMFTLVSVPLLVKLMVIINVGAAFIEPIKEIFFFRVVQKGEEDRLYGIFSAAYPVAYILAPLFGSLMLSSFGINGIWLGTAVVFILIALMSLTIDKKY